MKNLICSTLLAFALSASALAATIAPGEVAVGETLGEATMQGLNGPARKLSSLRGKPLIINVWASWCGPCRQESASLERLAWREGNAPFRIIGISTDDDARAAKAWLAQSNATISHFIDRRLQMETMLGASHLPLTVLIDAKGKVLDKVYGAREWDNPDNIALINKAFRTRPAAR